MATEDNMRERRDRSLFEGLRRWRQAAVWAPVLWFPAVLTAFALGYQVIAVASAFAGILFAGICAGMVWFGRCPRCESRFGISVNVFRQFWDQASCANCGSSLFELRRASSERE